MVSHRDTKQQGDQLTSTVETFCGVKTRNTSESGTVNKRERERELNVSRMAAIDLNGQQFERTSDTFQCENDRWQLSSYHDRTYHASEFTVACVPRG